MNTEPQVDIFLKLGGSLITDKDRPRTARMDELRRLAAEVASALAKRPELRLLIGHGSGSFGHDAASRHGTRAGVRGPAGWRGFLEVWQAARALNQLVLESFSAAGLPVIAMPPSANFMAAGGQPAQVFSEPVRRALQAGLIPLVNGDVVFDQQIGGTILSTEDIFSVLAPVLKPSLILLAGREAGVYRDFPQRSLLVEHIDMNSLPGIEQALGGSTSPDVTGGMIQKVTRMLELAQKVSGLETWIFTGCQPGAVYSALTGQPYGTRISA